MHFHLLFLLLSFALFLPYSIPEIIQFPPIPFPNRRVLCRCELDEQFGPDQLSGVLKSPRHPSPYCGPGHCGWTIQPADNTFITAVIEEFDTAWHDTLDVYQTSNNGYRTLIVKQAELFRKFDPDTMDRHFSSSIGGGLQFRFNALKPNTESTGFQISWRRHNADDPSAAPCPPPFRLASSRPQPLAPLAPSFAPGSSCVVVLNSSWVILGTEPSVRLTIHQLDVHHLSIKIYESENYLKHGRGARVLTKIDATLTNQHQQMPFSVVSRTPSLTLVLRTKRQFEEDEDPKGLPGAEGAPPGDLLSSSTDNSEIEHENNLKKGPAMVASLTRSQWFDIEYQTAKSPCECFPEKLLVNRSHGAELVSPGYPLEYCDQANCTVNVLLENGGGGGGSGEALRIRFDKFSTYGMFDRLILWETAGGGHASVPMISLSNNLHGFQCITVDQHQFSLSFITDESYVDGGFKLNIERIKKSKNINCTCPGGSQLRELDGDRSHHVFLPISEQCTFLDCFWTFSPPNLTHRGNNWRLLLMINLSAPGFLEHYQGQNIYGHEDTEFMAQRYISSSIRMETIGYDVIEYQNSEELAEPINIWYHREMPESVWARRHLPKGIGPGFVDIRYELRGECTCGDRVHSLTTDEWRPLRSPDYPLPYCRQMSCEWLLQAPQGTRITINVSFFETENVIDQLKIFAGNSTIGRPLKNLSGKLRSGAQMHFKNANVLTLQFNSDSSVQQKGFELWLIAEVYSWPVSEMISEPTEEERQVYGPGTWHLNWAMFILAMIGLLFGGILVAANRRKLIPWIRPAELRNRLNGTLRNLGDRLMGRQAPSAPTDQNRVSTVTFANPAFSPAISFRELSLAHPDPDDEL